MLSFVVSASIAAAFTAVFAFRFSASRQPWMLLRYFLFFLVAEWGAEHFLLPPGTLGLEVAAVATGVTLLFILASVVRDHFDPG